MPTEIYIPPIGVLFCILGLPTQRVLVARRNGMVLGNRLVNDTVYSDSWFRLEQGPREGLLHPQRKRWRRARDLRQSNRASGEHPWTSLAVNQRGSGWQHFEIQPGSGLFDGYFRLYTPSENRVVWSNASFKGGVGGIAAHLEPQENQYFSSIIEDATLDRIVYDNDSGTLTYLAPSLFDSSARNETPSEQKFIVDTTHSVTRTVSFSHTTGYKLMVGEEV
ncbi:uncharacterized protein BDV14DRAFT_200275 [Aspergillus stella-maris]|uniref:uncharacterized protein n=1 Tax=Aspergillus stella-maris TaxID=1810926 RepID=UPI003CCCE9C8